MTFDAVATQKIGSTHAFFAFNLQGKNLKQSFGARNIQGIAAHMPFACITGASGFNDL
jgi:hypothetical protein